MADKWQSQLKDSFESYGEPAPEGLWEAVSAGVASAQAAARRRRRARIYGYSAAAFAALAALSVFLFSPSEKPASELAPAIAQLQQEPAIQQPELPVAPSEPQSSAPARVHHPAPRAAADASAAATPAPAASVPTSVPTSVPAPTPAPSPASVPEPETHEAKAPATDSFAALLAEDTPRRKRHKFSVSLLAANSRGIGPEHTGSHVASDNSYFQSASSSKPMKASDNYHHYQPFVTGVTVSWQFLPRLSLDGGVNYSRLYSERNPLYSDERDTDTMTLHYVGIPLSLRFNFLQTQRFNLYASAGGAAQKLVKGTHEVIRYSGSFRTLDYNDLQERQWQWSVNAGIGVSYKLISGMSLYVQPGMSYHFDNGSDLVNIYKRRPLNFSLSAGLRFDISR